MTGTWLSKNDPVLSETINNIRDVMESDNKRQNKLDTSFSNVIRKIRVAGQLGEGQYSEKEVNKARAARQSADAAKAAADREIEAAEKSVSQSDKQPTGSIESEASKKSEPKEPPSDASN